MPAKFTAAERRAQVLTVESLYLSGKTQADIAAQIGVSQQQVSKYLVRLQQAWLSRLGESLKSVKGRELARLDRLEREHWQAWARSCQNAQTTVNRAKTVTMKIEDGDAGLIELPALEREWTHTERGQVGDPRFLQGVHDCIEMRLRIVGGFADKAILLKTPEDKIIEALRSGRLDLAEVRARFPHKAEDWFAKAGIVVKVGNDAGA
jgi:predicted transcriptional regulator